MIQNNVYTLHSTLFQLPKILDLPNEALRGLSRELMANCVTCYQKRMNEIHISFLKYLQTMYFYRVEGITCTCFV